MCPDNRTLVIAEAGVNHNGDMALAKKLVDAARFAGADVVKFQMFSADELVTKDAKKAAYQLKNTNPSETQNEMLRDLELTHDDFRELSKYCRGVQIEFLVSAFDSRSLEQAFSLDVQRYKIPSGEITNLHYLQKVASFNRPTILSTGMADLNEVGDALDVLTSSGLDKNLLTVLHCNTDYPTDVSDVNLLAMTTISNVFDVKVGYSDHTMGCDVSLAAVAIGAKVIEKHLTLDRFQDGPDHSSSLEPNEFKQLVKSIRNVEIALGSQTKKPSKSEIKNKGVVRKSIVANKFIKKGDVFVQDDLGFKRPGYGLSPMLIDTVVGAVAKRDFQIDELIEL